MSKYIRSFFVYCFIFILSCINLVAFAAPAPAFPTIYSDIQIRQDLGLPPPGPLTDRDFDPFTAPVPEPETYIMMLMGIGVVKWATRRSHIIELKS